MFKNKLSGATLALSALLAIGGAAFAQDKSAPAPNTDKPQGREFGRGGKGFGGGEGFGRGGRQGRHGKHDMMRALHQLNLTDAQKEQLRGLQQQAAPQREEARQLLQQKRAGALDATGQARLEQLRKEFKANHEARRNQLLAILTPEQKAQLEQMKAQRKERGLNLTDAQQQQMKALHERFRQQDGPQREEAMKLMQQKRAGTLDANGEARLTELHKTFMAQMQARRAEMEAILTPEQKAKMDQMRQNLRGFGGGKMRHGKPSVAPPQN